MWADGSFPKTLNISSNFTDDEVANITEMNAAWNLAVENKRTFFTFGARVPEITNTINNLDSMLDGVMGIYKTDNWPAELPGSALAITQIFGRRHNVGTNSEFVNIEHADILINNDIHSFDTGPSGPNYDLRTVILHEMGHFLGLTHKNSSSNSNSSIMYPSISSSTYKRAPKQVDINDISSKYGITLSGGGSGGRAMATQNASRYEVDPREVGEAVKILIELHADGECIHKINGKTELRHHILKNQR